MLWPMEMPGLGLDLVSVPRFAAALERGGDAFRERLFTPAEQAQADSRSRPAQHYAARFAAKEAVMKALGRGFGQGVAFPEIEVVSDGRTPPRLELHGETAALAAAAGIVGWSLSLSHSDETAGAVVLARHG